MVVLKVKEEEKDILEELQDIVEDPSTIEIVKGEEKLETGNIRSGMTGSQLAQAEEEDLKMNTVITVATVKHRADPKGENLQGITQKSLLRRKRELGVLVQIEIIEEREV